MLIVNALLDAWAVLAPVVCAGCGSDDRALCVSCRNQLLPRLTATTVGGLRVVSALRYEGVARRVILALKEQGRTDAAPPLAAALAAAVAALHTDGIELMGVPPSSASYRRRGFDPVRLLLRRSGLPKPVRVLDRVRSTQRQKTLDLEGRRSNLVGSLRARSSLGGRRFLLVDDVLTTGATLDEAARAVREGGGIVTCAATLAFTPKRHPADSSASL